MPRVCASNVSGRDRFFALPDAYVVTDHRGVIRKASPQPLRCLVCRPPRCAAGRSCCALQRSNARPSVPSSPRPSGTTVQRFSTLWLRMSELLSGRWRENWPAVVMAADHQGHLRLLG